MAATVLLAAASPSWTGRAGASGIAVTFVDWEDLARWATAEHDVAVIGSGHVGATTAYALTLSGALRYNGITGASIAFRAVWEGWSSLGDLSTRDGLPDDRVTATPLGVDAAWFAAGPPVVPCQ